MLITRGPSKLKNGLVWLKRRFKSRALILVYHRVIDVPNDPYLIAVKPQHFVEHMEVLCRHAVLIRLEELVEALRRGRVPDRAIAITFDDGYADNLHYAKPLLEHYEVPATVFIAAGHVGSRREFWWDELDRLLLQPGRLPAELRLTTNETEFEWKLGEASNYSEQDFYRYRDWHIERRDNPSPRHLAFRMLYEKLHTLPVQEQQSALDCLLLWSGADPGSRITHQALTMDEAVLLARGGLIEVGAHTMNHCNLAALSAEEQRREIRCSKEVLEQIVGGPIKSFSLPYGLGNSETVGILHEVGFESACTSDPDAIWKNVDVFHLPRVAVLDWDRNRFTHWLEGLLRS